MAQQLTSRDLDVLLLAQELLASGEAAALRKRAGLSQRQVAARIRTDHTAVGRWERLERRPRGELALRYARFLARLVEHEQAAKMEAAA
jgi:transcriptional regulator with XRE-family HTH domain